MSRAIVIVQSRLATGLGRCVTWVTVRRGYPPAMPKRRLDTLLAERGLFETRTRAAAAVMAGDVRVGDRPARKPGELVAPDAPLEVAERPAFVSRGGVKLANALDAFGIDPAGRRALDVGASTGGFTDCLLQRGADAVIALDVAYGELHWTLRNDARVTVIERCNARNLQPGDLPWPPDLIVADVSFISLTKVLPAVLAAAAPRFECLALVKPQFEAGRERIAKGGVVRDAADRRAPSWRWRRTHGASSAPLCSASPPRACPGRRATGRASSGSRKAAARVRSRTWRRRRAGRSHDRGAALDNRVHPYAPGGHRRRAAASGRAGHRGRRRGAAAVRRDREVRRGGRGGAKASEPVVGTDLALVLGGDGTILTALREFANTGVPVFALNYGAIGFLATIEPWSSRTACGARCAASST